ncbi:MAG: cytochrome P450 [Actinomycetota bacterium]|nr:cytochrome P450 [Actinomycetota bacterium]
MSSPAELSPIQAVTHPDPYPYYAELVERRPFYFDDTLRCWVASSADAVTVVLGRPDCQVRPAAEPVPRGILGTPAGEVFGNLVRMTDGPSQHRLKAVVVDALGRVPAGEVSATSTERARLILKRSVAPLQVSEHRSEVRARSGAIGNAVSEHRSEVRARSGAIGNAVSEHRSEVRARSGAIGSELDDLMFALPAQVIAGLCGLDDGADERASELIGEFVQCLPATASPDQLAGAVRAAAELQQLMGPKLSEESTGLLGELVRAARRADWSEQAPLLANGIGFLSQTYDATAGLIGNAIVALAREGRPAELEPFVREVARHDSPVHNTRRFATLAFDYAGCQVEQGESLLLVLAAANRDGSVNPEPASFRTDRSTPVLFTFGAAGHGCPGEELAVRIATAAVEQLLEAGIEPAQLCGSGVGYRPSGNIRTPVFPGAVRATEARASA